MKITEIVCQVLRCESVVAKTASCQDVVLVRVRTDDGLEGIGEADSSPEVVKAIIDAPFSHNIACGLRQILIGENPLEAERLWQKMNRRTMYFGRTSVTVSAMAAVDMALWDLKGKAFGQPIHRLLGGAFHKEIPAYASILFDEPGYQAGIEITRHMASANSNYFLPCQFENQLNAVDHEHETAPEILRDAPGPIDVFVTGYGTGGTLAGCSKSFKAAVPVVFTNSVQ